MTVNLVITEFREKMMGFVYEDMTLTSAHLFSDESIVGNVYIARVDQILKNIDAAFLDIGEKDSVFYQISDNNDKLIPVHIQKEGRLSVGDDILVMVSKEATGSKKAVAVSEISVKGEDLLINNSGTIGISHKIKNESIRDGLKASVEEAIKETEIQSQGMKFGALVRTSAESKNPEVIKKETIKILCELDSLISRSRFMKPGTCIYSPGSDMTRLLDEIGRTYENGSFNIITDIEDVYNELSSKGYKNIELYKDRLTSLSNVFNIERSLDKALARRVSFASGAELVIDRTEAMTVIDVNSSRAVKGRDSEEFILNLNKKAATAVAKELRVRNLSGIIIVDFINMKNKENRKNLITHLKHELSLDRVKCNFVDITGLGLVEITRKKVYRSLYEIV